MTAEAYPRSLLASLKAVARVWVLNLRSVLVLPPGLLQYRRTGRTPESAHQAMIWLFCVSRGKFNDLVARMIARRRPKIAIADPRGVLGDMSRERGAQLAGRLERDGFLVFPRALPAQACDRLMEFALSTPASVRRMAGEPHDAPPRVALFAPEQPLAVRYDYEPNDLLRQPEVQALLADGSLLALVQEYLGCAPLADVLSMWWHTNFHTQPDAEAAQFFHFDMDRIKWLKIFVYLTDVGPENGPHSFVRGTHRTGAIPDRVLRRGYVRLTDEEVEACYAPDDIKSFSAPRGSIIVEDTRGLHKGNTVSGGPRLVLQLQFSNTLCGTNYPKATMGEVVDPGLRAMLAQAPMVYRQYT